MVKIAGVKFRNNWKIYDFDATGSDLSPGDKVIVDSERGLGIATVVRVKEMEQPPAVLQPAARTEQQGEDSQDAEIEVDIEDALKEQPGPPPEKSKGIRKVLRRATDEDLKRDEENRGKEADAFNLCKQLIAERELPMRLVRAEFSFDATRATFFFFAETRVDFRELVKELAHRLHMRIEMRQIGVRDVARLIGGLGPCGRELCCASFLRNFEPVSIRMAKKQELVLNPAKISGVCGRLLCCLSYEFEMYDDIKKDMADIRAALERERREAEEQRLEAERREMERRLAEEKKREEERRLEQQRREEEHRQQKRSVQPSVQREKQQPGPGQQRHEGIQGAQEPKKEGKKRKRRFWRKKKSKQGGPEGDTPQQT